MTKEDEDLMRCIKMDYGMMNLDDLYEDELKKVYIITGSIRSFN